MPAGTSFGNTLVLWACPELERRIWIEAEGGEGVPQECRMRFKLGGGNTTVDQVSRKKCNSDTICMLGLDLLDDPHSSGTDLTGWAAIGLC